MLAAVSAIDAHTPPCTIPYGCRCCLAITTRPATRAGLISSHRTPSPSANPVSPGAGGSGT